MRAAIDAGASAAAAGSIFVFYGPHRAGNEFEVVHVVELSRIMFGPFGIEQFQAARPRFE